MSAPKAARALIWRGKWYFFFTNPSGRQKRLLCESLGCFNEAQRDKTVDLLRERERDESATRLRLRQVLDYDHNLASAIGDYLTHSDGRRDLAESSKAEVHKAVDPFLAWIRERHPRLETAALGAQVISAFLRTRTAKPITVNKMRRNLKQMLRWLDSVRPRMFPEIAHLMPGLKEEPVDRREAVAYTPAELRRGLSVLEPDQARLYLFLACIGCRLGEAHALTWDDVDLERGRITFRPPATRSSAKKRPRIFPLINSPEGQLAPALLTALREWKDLGFPPCGGKYNREQWDWREVIGPQELRRNWVSYAYSFGIPAAVAAELAAHSIQTAQRWYRMQVLERRKARSLQAAMGL